jgi:hypothetical protein
VVKLAAAQASFKRKYGDVPAEALKLMRQLRESQDYGRDQARVTCPVCQSPGVGTGSYDVVWEPDWEGDRIINAAGTLWFEADSFACRVCGLRLDSAAELGAADMETRWKIEDADPRAYEPYDEDSAYEAWREAQYEDYEPPVDEALYEAWREAQRERGE